MYRRTQTLLAAMALGVGGLLIACSPGGEAGATHSPPATGNMVVEGAWQGRYSTVEKGSRAQPDPVHESVSLRLSLGSGTDDYPRALVDVSRLPAPLAKGTYSLGPNHDIRGEVILRPKDPSGSGLRFALKSGQFVVRQTGDQISGSFEAEGEELTFNKPRRRVQVRGDFAGVVFQQ